MADNKSDIKITVVTAQEIVDMRHRGPSIVHPDYNRGWKDAVEYMKRPKNTKDKDELTR